MPLKVFKGDKTGDIHTTKTRSIPHQRTQIPKKPAMGQTFILSSFLLFHLIFSCSHWVFTDAAGGQWQLLQKSIGVSAMHMQLLNNDRVIMFDRTDFGPSNLSLPNGRCRNNPRDLALKIDCTAHSVEYNVEANTFRALFVQSNLWCSSGAVFPDGRLIQTGGFNDGEKKIRSFMPCNDTSCDWKEFDGLGARRWYATNHILPGSRQIIIGGRRQFNYEFYPKDGAPNVYSLPFLVQTNDPKVENNLYPFVFLNVDGFLFIFANNRAILFDYVNNKVIKEYPIIPGGDPRSYPSTGSAVLLPLKLQAPAISAEVLICGGAPKGAYEKAERGIFVEALNTCARIKITDPNPTWAVETMPLARVMGDMILLPNGNVLIINGVRRGTAGWDFGRDAVLSPVVYRPDKPSGSRFELQNPSTIPRVYHSTAGLLRDGRVLVAGSNAHAHYNFTGVLFPTELRVEAFHPYYMDPPFAKLQPTIVSPASQFKLKYKQTFTVQFTAPDMVALKELSVTMVAPSFNTHSFSMNQRLLVLPSDSATKLGNSTYQIVVTAPASANLAPPGYYLLFVVHQDVPSKGIWVQLQ